ncbi:hypothetical protein [Cupriavidus sp. PET2-C1]
MLTHRAALVDALYSETCEDVITPWTTRRLLAHRRFKALSSKEL